MSDIKEQLYKELAVKNASMVEGIKVDPSIFKYLDFDGKYQKQIHTMFEYDHHPHTGIDFPVGFNTPGGLKVSFRWDNRSKYEIKYDNGNYYLTENSNLIFPIEFLSRPQYYNYKTSDGTEMSHIATYNREGAIFVAYSNECALKDKGLDCLFCNINATKDTYAEKEGITWKHPNQIGETAAAAYKNGTKHITISGGFVPERREVDYYIDVAEAIKEYTGLDDFNGTGVIGAPLDFEVIDRYKEAGYRTIGMNIEVWDKNIYKSICPGKVEQCGGWDHWVEALEYAVKVFGYGRVRSNIVGGIEPKKSTLEGVEYLASKGIICGVAAWCPNPGSQLEGHRTPEPEWHLDMAYRVYNIFRKAGFTYEQLYDCNAQPTTLCHDLYKIEDELLPVFKREVIKN
ncbi:radical SAM protein [Clostridium tyrobutyricum]|uniref:radical SAM protein n=1 Tax=Clostridium tyrobutyricum TaxID=1519 RepID=UPI001C38219E|nr:radical SAM protein [Clostridium tyrobutyricum]MBV4428064.1 radical SAM protein [Clostridium tyrobutyricum]MBV4443511.1 radical SAM protein [Clostridium tyrobutyricum]